MNATKVEKISSMIYGDSKPKYLNNGQSAAKLIIISVYKIKFEKGGFIMDALRFEQWKPISQKSVPGVIPGVYYISDFGRVYSLIRNNFLNPTPT